MVAKALIVVAAAVAATASFPAFQMERAPVVVKGDRLPIAVRACAPDCTALATATRGGRWLTIEQPAGEAGSVLYRVPVADMASAAIVSQVFSHASRSDGTIGPIGSTQR